MENPLISVIIAVYNGERFLKQAIESAINQSYPNVEIIVVDDGSTDSSAQIAKSFDQVIYAHQPNAGVASARNAALKIAKGEMIAFLDSDDFYYKDKLKHQAQHLSSNPSLDGSLALLRNFIEPGFELSSEMQEYFLTREKVSITTILASKLVFNKVGEFNTDYKAGSDFEWTTRAKEMNLKIEVLAEKLLHRRIHDRNLTLLRKREDKHMRLSIIRESLARKRKMELGKS